MKAKADPFEGFVQISLFAYEPDWIDLELCRGSGFQDGHKRIVEAKAKGLPIDAFAKFLKNEYGTGGHCGPGMCYENHNSRGMEIENRDRTVKVNMTWLEVASRIANLIEQDIYRDRR